MRHFILYIALFILLVGYSRAAETDAVYKKIKKEYIMNADGSLEYKYFKELKLLSVYSFDRLFGETFVVYNPDFQKLVIHQAYTVMANGRKVPVPQNAFNEVLPHDAADYPAYNQMREMVITHTGLEVGATIFLEYSIISKPSFIKELMGMEIVAEDVPVEDFELTVTVPARRGLKYAVLNTTMEPAANQAETTRSFTWNFKNVKARSFEDSSPASSQYLPTIVFSTLTKTQAAFDAFAQNKAFTYKPTESEKALLEKLKTDTKTNTQWALNIQDYVANKINGKYIPLSWHNFELQTPGQVFNSAAGGELEKTMLLFHLLKSAGLNVKPVAFVPVVLWNAQIGNLNFMNQWGVLYTDEAGVPFVLSAKETNQQSLHLKLTNQVMVDLFTAKTVELKTTLPSISMNSRLTVDPDNAISGQVMLKLTGSCFDFLTLSKDSSAIQNYIVNGIPMAKDEKPQLVIPDNQVAKFEMNVKSDGKLKKQENYYFMPLPYLRNGIVSQNFTNLPSKRDFPITVKAIDESYEFVITLPKSVEWVGVEKQLDFNESFGKMSISVARRDGNIVIKKSLVIFPAEISVQTPKGPATIDNKSTELFQRNLTVEEYAIFRKMMIEWNSNWLNELVLKR